MRGKRWGGGCNVTPKHGNGHRGSSSCTVFLLSLWYSSGRNHSFNDHRSHIRSWYSWYIFQFVSKAAVSTQLAYMAKEWNAGRSCIFECLSAGLIRHLNSHFTLKKPQSTQAFQSLIRSSPAADKGRRSNVKVEAGQRLKAPKICLSVYLPELAPLVPTMLITTHFTALKTEYQDQEQYTTFFFAVFTLSCCHRRAVSPSIKFSKSL